MPRAPLVVERKTLSPSKPKLRARARALALLSPEDRLPVAARSLTGGGGGTRAKVALVAAAAAVAFGALSSLPLSFPLSLAGRQALTHLFLSSFANPAPSHPRPALSLPSCSPVRSVGRSWHHSVLVGVGGRQDEGGNDRYENETVRSFWRESRA